MADDQKVEEQFPAPICYGCSNPLTKPGGLLIGPPTVPPFINKMRMQAQEEDTVWVRKRHLCDECHLICLAALESAPHHIHSEHIAKAAAAAYLNAPPPPPRIPHGSELWNYTWLARHRAIRAYKKSIQPERH